jgi:hypothetical protein
MGKLYYHRDVRSWDVRALCVCLSSKLRAYSSLRSFLVSGRLLYISPLSYSVILCSLLGQSINHAQYVTRVSDANSEYSDSTILDTASKGVRLDWGKDLT